LRMAFADLTPREADQVAAIVAQNEEDRYKHKGDAGTSPLDASHQGLRGRRRSDCLMHREVPASLLDSLHIGPCCPKFQGSGGTSPSHVHHPARSDFHVRPGILKPKGPYQRRAAMGGTSQTVSGRKE
jgi:hypothetical protein